MDELFLNDERVMTVALLGLLRRDGMASKVTAVGIIPIEKLCWRMLLDACTCIVFSISSQRKSSKQCSLPSAACP
jgi:hypothetical protein